MGGGAGAGGPQLAALSLGMASLPDLMPTINKVTHGMEPHFLALSAPACHTPTAAIRFLRGQCDPTLLPYPSQSLPLTVCSVVAKETSFWCLVAMEMSGGLFLGCGTGVVVEGRWVPSLTSPSLHSSVGAPGRRPVPQERAPESCVPETTARLVALTAEAPSPERAGPS